MGMSRGWRELGTTYDVVNGISIDYSSRKKCIWWIWLKWGFWNGIKCRCNGVEGKAGWLMWWCVRLGLAFKSGPQGCVMSYRAHGITWICETGQHCNRRHTNQRAPWGPYCTAACGLVALCCTGLTANARTELRGSADAGFGALWLRSCN